VDPDSGRVRAGARWLPVVAVLLLAVNLRAAVNALGAVVPELRQDTGLSASLTGVLFRCRWSCSPSSG